MAATAGAAPPSLRTRVLRHVMVPLAVAWLAGTAGALAVVNFFTQQAFDQAMLDDAHSIAANVRAGEGGALELLLTPREMTTVLFDQVERVYYAVRRSDGSLLAGSAQLSPPVPAGADGQDYRFSDIVFDNQPLRAVVLTQDAPAAFQVVVAQTTRTRTALLVRLLGYATLLLTVLMLLLAVWLWRGIARDLAPLGQLERALDQRDASDLSPVPVPATARELERLGRAVNGLFERVGHSVRAQREFAGNVAHERRTPLAGIRALAAYGLRQSSPEVWREQLQRIAESQARASHLVDQLLALALADEARALPPRETLALDELAGEAVIRHLARADAQGVDLGARGLDDELLVRGHASLIEGILDNLIDNALRYGGRTVTVELADGVLSVVDDGPGIPPEARQDLMQRWAQGAEGHRLGQGAGLGLAIVARYAQLLGADLVLGPASEAGGLRASVDFGPARVRSVQQ